MAFGEVGRIPAVEHPPDCGVGHGPRAGAIASGGFGERRLDIDDAHLGLVVGEQIDELGANAGSMPRA
jgi:hypothetical protein